MGRKAKATTMKAGRTAVFDSPEPAFGVNIDISKPEARPRLEFSLNFRDKKYETGVSFQLKFKNTEKAMAFGRRISKACPRLKFLGVSS